MNVRYVHMGSAKCALDIGDGSERGEYVCQDYILMKLGRPHRAVNIMYTYYPKDKEWPARISEACADMNVGFAWDYPYDDYFPFADNGPQFDQMRDIRMHGQDVMLTITIDCSLEDSYLRDIARRISTFGRLRIRINHECTGDWFTHNKRFTYKEIGDFFTRFATIIKEEAPNVKTILCAGLLMDPDENGEQKVEQEEALESAYKAADIWSSDKYLALHYGWPYDVAEPLKFHEGDKPVSYCYQGVDETYDRFRATYKYLSEKYGRKPFIQAELNADGDVTGAFHQADPVMRYYGRIREDKNSFLTGVSMYQFRDRGRLGLEIEAAGNSSVGIEQPIMKEYKKVLFDDCFYPSMTVGESAIFPAKLRWGGAEDADGIQYDIDFEKTPEFCEVTLQEDLALMIEFNGKWFYKAPGVSYMDLMPAFYEKPLDKAATLSVRIFATPTDGENHDDGSDDWAINSYSIMNCEPKFRIRYEVPGLVY